MNKQLTIPCSVQGSGLREGHSAASNQQLCVITCGTDCWSGICCMQKNGLSFDSLIISRLLRGSLFIQGNKLILLAWVLSSLIITEFGNFLLDAFLPVLCLVYDSVPHAKATAGRYWTLVAPFCIIQSCKSLQREVRTVVLKWAGPCHLLMTCKVTN